MNVLILNGSLRREQNTDTLTEHVAKALASGGAQVEQVLLSEQGINACMGCYACQGVVDEYGCVIDDDMHEVAASILKADVILFATPIYTWYCTVPMKAVLDRHYGLNKFYGDTERVSLWENRRVGIIVTHGYDRMYGAGPFETGIRHLCEHSGLHFAGTLSGRDLDDRASFITEEAVANARTFAAHILQQREGEILCEF